MTQAKKTPPKSKAQKERERLAARRQMKAGMRERCCELYRQGMSQARITEELGGVHQKTVARWLKEGGVEIRPRHKAEPLPEDDDIEPAPDMFEQHLAQTTEETVVNERMSARDEEQRKLLEIAQNQASPADQYQSYVASMAIKIMRDNLLNIRGPRTVRELSELDQLIRRNLGLNAKGVGGGGGSVTIDINVLNNAKAATGGARVVIDAEPYTEEEEEDEDAG